MRMRPSTMSPMCQSFLKPFGKALALLFLPYLSAFLLQSNHLLRIYIAVLVAPTPNPQPVKTPDSVTPTTPGRKWRIISAISVFSILSLVQFRTVLQNLTPEAIVEASNAFNKYFIYACLFITVTSTTAQIVCPSKTIIHRNADGKYIDVAQGGLALAAKQHPFLAILLTLSMGFFDVLMIGGLSNTNNSLSIIVLTTTYVASIMMVGRLSFRKLVKGYHFIIITSALVGFATMFAAMKYGGESTSELKEDEIWSTNLYKNLRYVTFLPTAIGSLCSGVLIAIMLRFDFNRFCVAEPHAKLSYETVTHPTDPTMGKGIVVPRSVPVKFSRPYYILALSTWSIIRITTLAVCIGTGFPFKSPYDACFLGMFLEIPIMTIVIFLFATMRGEAKALWRYKEAWVKKPLSVKQAQPEPVVSEGEPLVKENELVVEKEDELIVIEGDLLLLNEDKVVPANEDLMV